MNILNFTQHASSQEQIQAGVVDMPARYAEGAREILTFNGIPTFEDLCKRAEMAVDAIWNWEDGQELGLPKREDLEAVMIGGAPWFMPILEKALIEKGYKVLYAFSDRVSTEIDGVKTSTFKHLGFYEAR